MTLHSILGGSRVKKRASSTPTKRTSSSTTSSWAASLARTKPGTTTPSKSNNNNNNNNQGYHQKLDDFGPAPLPLLLTPKPTPTPTPTPTPSLSLPPTPLHLHTHTLTTMFAPLPQSGLHHTLVTTILNSRAALPPVTSASHLHQLLLLAAGGMSSPAAAERAVAGAVRRGEVRRVVLPAAGYGHGSGWFGGELVVAEEELERMVMKSAGLGEEGLRAHPGRVGMFDREGAEAEAEGRLFDGREVDALVRAGFLTAVNQGGGVVGLRARPEERYAMISLETVARAAAGSVAAAGGQGVLHAAGGTGRRGLTGPAGTGAGVASGGFRIAVPGSGVFIKLVSAALEHLADLLRKTQYRELSESDLREKWDGGVAGDSEVALVKKTRGEFAGVVPGRTKKWKQFQGLAFDWVLREAVGAGMVEIFETRSVGRGVRLV